MTNLTPDQKRIMLILADAAEDDNGNPWVRLVTTQGINPIRETTTGDALVRKGLARKSNKTGRYRATTDGFWIGDALRIEDRQGKIPARRCPR